MSKDELMNITDYIVWNIARNRDFMYHDYKFDKEKLDDYIDELIAMVFSLHDLLYNEINGDRYNYMWHWTNKIGINYYDDKMCEHFFDDIMKEGEKAWQN